MDNVETILDRPASSFPDSTDAPAARDWRWQMAHCIRSVPDLLARFASLHDPASITLVSDKYPLSITPYYAALIQRPDNTDPLFRMCVPQIEELTDPSHLSSDPYREDHKMPVPHLIRRYEDRALLMATTSCAVRCRHCTRKRLSGMKDSVVSASQLGSIADYLRVHPEIREVLISGGDPLTLADDKLKEIFSALKTVPSLEILRLGTRVPVVMPQRITPVLTDILRRHHPLWINTHFNHPRELTPEAERACALLADAGCPLGNQTVLLRGVNDDPHTLEALFRGLLKMRVRPYYLFQCDLVQGVEHLRTPIRRGLEIMEHLRAHVTGLAIPQFVADTPGGGKIPLTISHIVSTCPTHTVLLDYENQHVAYPEPI